MSETATIVVAILTTIAAVGAGAGKHIIQGIRSQRHGVEDSDTQAPAPPAPTPVAGFDRLVEQMSDHIVRLDGQIKRLEADRRVANERIDRIEGEIVHERTMKRTAINHIRALYAWIAERMPGAEPPDVPDDLQPHFYVPWREPNDP